MTPDAEREGHAHGRPGATDGEAEDRATRPPPAPARGADGPSGSGHPANAGPTATAPPVVVAQREPASARAPDASAPIPRRGDARHEGLRAGDFTRIAGNGFGDPQNSYAHSMTRFRDSVYVGTSRHSLALLKLFPPRDPPAMDPWPVPVPSRVEDLDMHGEIWRCDPDGDGWTLAHRSPAIDGRGGEPVPRELGYRGMAVFQGRSDPEPALYVSSVSSVSRGTGARLLRSADGTSFEAVSSPGLGDPNVSSLRSLVEFDGHLYAAPTGEGTTWNTVARPILLRTDDPCAEDWHQACPPAFGDTTNTGIFEVLVFDGHLYAGTFNAVEGYQVWKAAPNGAQAPRWTKVVDRGAGRGAANEMAMSMCVFDGALYVGSGIQNGGYDRQNLVGPAAAELIRIWPDDTWELVVGAPRSPRDGSRHPLSGAGPGFDNLFAGYVWRMIAHDGWLYATTFDWSVFLPYARRPPRSVRRMMRGLGTEQIVRHGGGFDLLCSRDGVSWTSVTETGFGNPYNHGGRNLLSTPQGLYVGTANPFGPEVAARISTGWVYVPNPQGGAEVWLGRSSTAEPCDEHPRRPPEIRVQSHEASPSKRAPRRREAPEPPDTLVTGASGFIGGHVLDELLARGERVRVLALEGTVANIRQPDRVETVVGSLSDPERLREAVRGIRQVYHLGALLPGAAPADLEEVNVRGTENLLRACREAASLERFVFTSSVAVYEGAFLPEDWPLAESAPLGPRGPDDLRNYGISKIAAERLVRRHAAEAGFGHVILRPSTCYGATSPGFREFVDVVLHDPRAGRGAGAGFPMQVLHVRDLAVVVAEAGERPEARDEVFNVAGAEGLAYGDVAAMIRRRAGIVDRTMLRPDRTWPWRRYMRPYDVSKARDVLGFVPRTTMADGLEEVVTAAGGAQPAPASERRWRLADRWQQGDTDEGPADWRPWAGWLAAR